MPDVYTAVSLFIDWIRSTASAHGGLATCADTAETGGSVTGQGKQGGHGTQPEMMKSMAGHKRLGISDLILLVLHNILVLNHNFVLARPNLHFNKLESKARYVGLLLAPAEGQRPACFRFYHGLCLKGKPWSCRHPVARGVTI